VIGDNTFVITENIIVENGVVLLLLETSSAINICIHRQNHWNELKENVTVFKVNA